MKKTFSKEILFDRTPRVFKRDATEVRFLLGGIGTGNFSVNSYFSQANAGAYPV